MMPNKISKQYDSNTSELINKALALKEEDRYAEALQIMIPLQQQEPDDSVIAGILASLYYETEDYLASEKYFRKTISLNPKSELASLGLFHSLMFLNKTDQALIELENFVKGSSPKLYKVTIEELLENITGYSINQREKIQKIIALTRAPD